ncbi:MAG: potassium channel family protein [Alphaproteobacteria bacterium]|jgi:voltage-gated potassium channel
MHSPTLKQKITDLYEGDSQTAHRFRYTLLVLDVVTILFLIGSTFFYGHTVVEWIDALFGLYIALDFFARLWIANKKTAFFLSPLNLADLVAMVSFLAPLLGENFAFLRGLRVLRLLRSYRLQARLREDFPYFRRHEDVIMSATNLFIFIFIMTELVFVTQVHDNPNVTNFLDAMYFTIAALTTTGFGDVTLQGDAGRALSIIIMIFGVSLFLRLIQTMFRPSKVRFTCDACGLFLHESDAVHCKHCGKVLNIPSDGDV